MVIEAVSGLVILPHHSSHGAHIDRLLCSLRACAFEPERVDQSANRLDAGIVEQLCKLLDVIPRLALPFNTDKHRVDAGLDADGEPGAGRRLQQTPSCRLTADEHQKQRRQRGADARQGRHGQGRGGAAPWLERPGRSHQKQTWKVG